MSWFIVFAAGGVKSIAQLFKITEPHSLFEETYKVLIE